MARKLSNHISNANDGAFDFNAFSTPPAPPPYHSASTPLPRQQIRVYPNLLQNNDRQYNSDNASRLRSVKEFVSNRLKNISSDISTPSIAKSTSSIDSNALGSFNLRFSSNEQQFTGNTYSHDSAYKGGLSINTNTNVNDTRTKNHEGLLSPAVSDSLERIGMSLQNLIDEAEASLLGPQNYAKNKLYPKSISRRTSPIPINQNNEESRETFADYSYRYVQQGYAHSQEQLTVAIEQLEQSIQTMLHFGQEKGTQPDTDKNVVIHHHHHHYVEEEEKVIKKKPSIENTIRAPSKSSPEDDDKWHITLITTLVMAAIGYISIRHSRKNRYGNMCLILLLLLSLYRKKNIKQRFPVMNQGDRFVVRLVFLKGTTPLLGFIHRFNILYHCVSRFFLK